MATTATLSVNIADTRLSTEKFPLKDRSLHLSVEIREKEILACLLDKRLNSYIAWVSLPFNTKEANLAEILKDEVLNNSFASVSVVFVANSSLLMPALFFKKEAVNSYLKLQQLDKPDETACYDYIKNLDSYNIYSVKSDLLTKVKAAFPSATFRHHSSIFIEYLLIEHKAMHDEKVFVSVFTKYMDIVVLNGSKLILSNRFYFENSSDFMYYLLWAYEQLKLDSEKTPCEFYGEIDEDKFNLAKKYLKKVKTGGKNEQSSYAAALDKLPAHRYRSLFTQYLCV
jgi:hypothetical protein